MSDLKEKIESLKYSRKTYEVHLSHIDYSMAIDDVQALPELSAVIEKAQKWDEAMAQPHYCDDCKAALLDQRILELECELVKYKEDAEKWRAFGKHETNLIDERSCNTKAQAYDKFTKGLKVEVGCIMCLDISLNNIVCPDCHGTGTVLRPLTDDEKVETVKVVMGQSWQTKQIREDDKEIWYQYFVYLPSGARVVKK